MNLHRLTSSGSLVLFHPLVSVNVRGLSANSFTTSAHHQGQMAEGLCSVLG